MANRKSDVFKKDNTPRKRISYKKEFQRAAKERDELRDQLQRVAADFDNYKKRTERERIALIETANTDLIASLLPVLDDFDRTLDTVEGSCDFDSLLNGVKLVHKNFLKILQDNGLVLLESKGKAFDPELHDALMQKSVAGMTPDIVLEEHVKGYEFKNRVIRHAKVVTSK